MSRIPNSYDKGPPDPPEPSALDLAVYELLENAGMPTELCDKVSEIISTWEREQEESSIEAYYDKKNLRE